MTAATRKPRSANPKTLKLRVANALKRATNELAVSKFHRSQRVRGWGAWSDGYALEQYWHQPDEHGATVHVTVGWNGNNLDTKTKRMAMVQGILEAAGFNVEPRADGLFVVRDTP